MKKSSRTESVIQPGGAVLQTDGSLAVCRSVKSA